MVGCKKKDVTPEPTTCNCYKTTYTIGAGGNYYYSSQTSPFVDYSEIPKLDKNGNFILKKI